MSGHKAWNAIDWTPERLRFLKKNFRAMTNMELADSLGLKLTSVRTKCYELGLKQMELEYWTKAQINYLVKHYHKKGDKELAEIFNAKWHKGKGWTRKHIEKKRRYLGLKRTKAERTAIREGHKLNGSYIRGSKKMWDTRGISPVGSLRIWHQKGRPFIVIRCEEGFRHYARWLWIQKKGLVKRGYVIRIKDRTKNITIRNLEMITREENAIRNKQMSLSYPEDLKQTITIFNKLNKKIKRYEKQD